MVTRIFVIAYTILYKFTDIIHICVFKQSFTQTNHCTSVYFIYHSQTEIILLKRKYIILTIICNTCFLELFNFSFFIFTTPYPGKQFIPTLKLMRKFSVISSEATWKFICILLLLLYFFLVILKYLTLIPTFGGNKCRNWTTEWMCEKNGKKNLKFVRQKKAKIPPKKCLSRYKNKEDKVIRKFKSKQIKYKKLNKFWIQRNIRKFIFQRMSFKNMFNFLANNSLNNSMPERLSDSFFPTQWISSFFLSLKPLIFGGEGVT